MRLQSWIPPSFAWSITPDVFCIDLPLNDPDIVEFISTGVREVSVNGTKKISMLVAAAMGKESLRGQLEESLWSPARLKPTDSRIKAETKVLAYCHGVFLLPDDKTLCVLVGRSKPHALYGWISEELKAAANALVLEHRSKVVEFDDVIERKRKANEDFYARSSDMKKYEGFAEARIAMESYFQRPVLTVERLLPLLPRAARFSQPTSADTERLTRAAVAAIAESSLQPSRDGTYDGILFTSARRRTQGLISWAPHTALPPYPEVRWAVQKRLPTALRKLRCEQMGKPMFDTGTKQTEDSVQSWGFDLEPADLKDALDDLQLDQSDFQKRIEDVGRDLKGYSFEAIAWFQPYHVWTEETWGIYFDSRKLDDLALSFLDEFKTARIYGSHSLAAFLAFGLTYAHELFHARVEAVLSWVEINAQQSRYMRYKERVYEALRETPDWLEEALANWSAWSWFKAPGTQSAVTGLASNFEGLNRVVEGSLDLAPPGYQEWRLGHQLGTWRMFANQLGTGKLRDTASKISLPLESVLTGPLPYDFQPADIPLRFVGAGVIADRLQSHPATFNVPTRRELERALKHFSHNLDASGGKGGHQKWTGPDQRAFILPTRDPVSPGVFKTFLHHVGIDKITYLRQVRPNL